MSLLEIVAVFSSLLFLCLCAGTTLHELGHFLAAYWFTNIRPTRLELGKGPTLLSLENPFRLRINLLPVGGLVAYAGEPGEPAASLGGASWDSASRRDRFLAAIGGPFIHATAFLVVLLALCLAASDRGLLWTGLAFNCVGQIALAVLSLRPHDLSDGGHIYRAVRSLPVDYSFGAVWRLAEAFWVIAVLGVASVIGFQFIPDS